MQGAGSVPRPASRSPRMSTSPLQIHQPEAADAESLGDRAYFAIRELIVTLELAPGSIVSERELQKRLGVGRTPVREALQRLEASGSSRCTRAEGSSSRT